MTSRENQKLQATIAPQMKIMESMVQGVIILNRFVMKLIRVDSEYFFNQKAFIDM